MFLVSNWWCNYNDIDYIVILGTMPISMRIDNNCLVLSVSMILLFVVFVSQKKTRDIPLIDFSKQHMGINVRLELS